MIEQRKLEHVNICLKEKVIAEYNYWNDIQLLHQALPELNFDTVDTTIKIFGANLRYPIIINAITGGYQEAENINRNLAQAAEELGIGLGVGSQRAAIEDKTLIRTYSVIKEFEIPLVIANLGVPQLIAQKNKKPLGIKEAKTAMEMIDADLLAIHLNYLQEIIQPEGDTNAEGCIEVIRRIASVVPTIVKETGAGISRPLALKLKRTGIKGIDISGLGGTNFAAVEYYRAKQNNDARRARLGELFLHWGIPSPVSLLFAQVGLPIIASGGIRSGLDVARALTLGASVVGIAGKILKPATESADAVSQELRNIIEELKTAMFLTGSKTVSELKQKEYIIIGKTKDWLD